MRDVLRVHVLDAQEDLLDEVGSLLLRKTLLFGNEVEELASAKPGGRKIKNEWFLTRNLCKACCLE